MAASPRDTDDPWRRYLGFAFAGFFALLFLPFWKSIVLSFLFGLGLLPVVEKILQTCKWQSQRARYGVVAAVSAAAIFVFSLVGFSIYSLVAGWAENPNIVLGPLRKGLELRTQLLQWLDSRLWATPLQLADRLAQFISDFAGQAPGKMLAVMVQELPFFSLEIVVFAGVLVWFLAHAPDDIMERLGALTPHKDVRPFFNEVKTICARTLVSIFAVGSLQALVVAIAAMLMGYGHLGAIFSMSLIFSLVPVLGAGFVPLVMGAGAWSQSDNALALILIILGLFVNTFDGLIRAWFFSRVSQVSPWSLFLAVVGAISLFGIPGLFIAPVLQQLTVRFFWPATSIEKGKSV